VATVDMAMMDMAVAMKEGAVVTMMEGTAVAMMDMAAGMTMATVAMVETLGVRLGLHWDLEEFHSALLGMNKYLRNESVPMRLQR